METLAFALIALFVLAFGLISGRLQKSVITPPMIFVLFGLLLSSEILGIIEVDIESELIRTLAELTLILILFTDALRIELKLLRREHTIPVRMLGISMPLTIIFGGLFAALLFDYLEFWEAAVVAAVLAPTDAALGQAVVSSPKVPVRIRQALNVESGLNDGIALPVILILLSLASIAEANASVSYWVSFTAMQIILGPVVGVAIGFLGGKLVKAASTSRWMNHAFLELSALALALLAFALAELIGGNGFIAAFSAGITVGNTSRSICSALYEFGEIEGQLLTLLTFLSYGAIMVLPALAELSWQIILYSLLSLTVIRIVPVAISLIGMRLQFDTLLFLGWFGPRGIASILFGLLVLEQTDIIGREEIFTIIVVTVLMSIFAHGLTALPGANWYAARAEEMKEEPDMTELMPVTEMPVRIRHME